eukprot:jgi/Galph1/1268/GphlegSOOS_G6077.1
MNLQLEDGDESSSKSPEYFLPTGLTDEESGDDFSQLATSIQDRNDSFGAPQVFDNNNHSKDGRQTGRRNSFTSCYSSPDPFAVGANNVSGGINFKDNKAGKSSERVAIQTPVSGGLFHRTLSSYQTDQLKFSGNYPQEEFSRPSVDNSTSEGYYPSGVYSSSGEHMPSSPLPNLLGSVPSYIVAAPTQTIPYANSNIFGTSTFSSDAPDPRYATFSSQSYAGSSLSGPSYSSSIPRESAAGRVSLIPDDSSTSSFTSYVDAPMFPFASPTERDGSSHHSSGWNPSNNYNRENRNWSQKMCRYWPHCPHGDSCKFYHPSPVSPPAAMTIQANENQTSRQRSGSWSGLWSSNAAIEWMHTVIQRHNLFNFTHRHRNQPNAVVADGPLIYGDRVEDTSREHRSTIGNLFHSGFIVGQRHKNASKDDRNGKKAEKQKKNKKKENQSRQKQGENLSSESGKDANSSSYPNSLQQTYNSVPSSDAHTSRSTDGVSENSKYSTSSVALSGSMGEDENGQSRKLTRAEKRRLRAIRFYESKRRAAEELKQKQQDNVDMEKEGGKTEAVATQEKKLKKLVVVQVGVDALVDNSIQETTESAGIDVTTNNIEYNDERKDDLSPLGINEKETDIFYDAPQIDSELLLGASCSADENLNEEEIHSLVTSSEDLVSQPQNEKSSSDLSEKRMDNEKVENVLSENVKNRLTSESGAFIDCLSREKDFIACTAKDQLTCSMDNDWQFFDDPVGKRFISLNEDNVNASNNILYSFLMGILDYFSRENSSFLLCFLVLYGFPFLSSMVTYVLPRPLSVNSLWFVLLMLNFWSWQYSDNWWKRFFSRYAIPFYFVFRGLSHLTFVDDLTAMERILLAYLLCTIRSGDLWRGRASMFVLCLQFISLETFGNCRLSWLPLLQLVLVIVYLFYMQRRRENNKLGKQALLEKS